MKNLYIQIFFLFLYCFFSSDIHSQWISKSGITTYNVTDIKFINPVTGYLCTSYEPWPGTVNGQLIKTTNSGQNWSTVFTDYHKKFLKIFFIDANTGFARLLPYVNYTYLNNVCRTTNGGLNWDTVLYNCPINDFYFLNTNTGWGVGSTFSSGIYTGKILKTTNNGNTWTTITLGYFNLKAVQFLDSVTGFTSGSILNSGSSTYKDIILKTTNAGQSWEMKDSSFIFNVLSQSFVNSLTGFIAGSNGNIIKTTNGGNSWQSLTTGFTSDVVSICFVNTDRGWAVTPTSIFYTSNSGLNWSQQYFVSGNNFNVITMTGLYNGWVGGQGGAILTTSNGGSTHMERVSPEIPDKYFLSQNYPNPFNPTTNIYFELPANLFVSLKIFDITGKEVESILNKNLDAGKYNIIWNAKNYSSGTYFYKLETNEFTETKRMILLK